MAVASPADTIPAAPAIDPVLAALQAIQAQLQAGGPAASAELTLTRKAARWRGLAALVASVAGISYAAFNAATDHVAARHEDRVEALERKVDAVSEDVAAIRDALHDRAAP